MFLHKSSKTRNLNTYYAGCNKILLWKQKPLSLNKWVYIAFTGWNLESVENTGLICREYKNVEKYNNTLEWSLRDGWLHSHILKDGEGCASQFLQIITISYFWVVGIIAYFPILFAWVLWYQMILCSLMTMICLGFIRSI